MSNWYKQSQQKMTGFKIVSWDGFKANSLQNKDQTYDISKGSVHSDLYLGTTEKFCVDYYTGLTDDQDMILTYSYDPSDIVSGGGENSEVFVKKATLIDARIL